MLLLGLGALLVAGLVAAVAIVDARAERRRRSRTVALVSAYGVLTLDDEADGRGGSLLRLSAFTDLGRRLAVRLTRPSSRASLQRRLDLAGNPVRWTAERVLAAKGGGLVAGAIVGALMASRSSFGILVLAVGGGAVVGFVLPDLLLYNAGQKRQLVLQKSLADAVDLLVISVQAGLGFDAALAQVGRNTTGPLAGEFNRVLQEMQIGKSRREALSALGERTTGSDVKHFIGAIVQADALGIPVTNVLTEQSKEMRTRRRQLAEEQAQKVPVKILFPLMTMILPALFIVVIGPAAINAFQTFSGG